MKWLVICLICLIFSLIPAKFFRHLIDFLETTSARWKAQGLCQRGSDLWSQLGDLMGPSRTGDRQLVSYKFFTALALQIMTYQQHFGGKTSLLLKDLRQQLMVDVNGERRLSKVMLEGHLQMALAIGLTWMMAVSMSATLQRPLAAPILFLMIGIQGAGVFLYGLLAKRLRRHHFGELASLWRVVVCLKALCGLRLSTQRVIKLAQLDTLKISDGTMRSLQGRLSQALIDWQSTGRPLGEELEGLGLELKGIHTLKIESFGRALGALKMGLVAVTAMVPYFLLMLNMMNAFFIE